MKSPTFDSTSATLRSPLFGSTRARRVLSVIDLLLAWQERARQRHALQQLDERQLRDIGLTSADVDFECSKPSWRL